MTPPTTDSPPTSPGAPAGRTPDLVDAPASPIRPAGTGGPGRTAWVDVARGMAITLMVAGHVIGGLSAAGLAEKGGLPQRFYDWTYAFHMPAFFVLSGLFLESSLRRGTGLFVVERLKSLYYPCVLWNVAYWLPGRLVPGLTRTESPRSFPLEFLYHPQEGLWFLMTLLALSVAYAVVRLVRMPATVLLVVAVAGVAVCWPMPEPEQDELRGLLLHLSWFGSWLMLGAAFSGAIREGAAKTPTGVLVALGALGALGLTATLAPTDIRQPPRPVGAPLGIAMLLAWSVVVARLEGGRLGWVSRGLSLLGERSLEIYLVSGFAMVGARMVLTRVLHISEAGTLFAAGTMAGLAVPLVVWWVTDRLRFPWLFRLGRRG